MATYLQPSWNSQAAEITAVVGIQSKCWRHVRRCLESLYWQTVPLRFIIVAYGPDARHLRQIRTLAQADWIRLIEVTRDTQPWREGRALNIGIRRAETPYVFTTNADLIFAPNFVECVLNALKSGPGILVISDRTDLDVNGRVTGVAPNCFYGTCLGTSREWWHRVRGFDERYAGWGRVDHDLYNRARSDGLKVVNVTGTEVWHQYHKHISPRLFTPDIRSANDYIFYNDTSIVRNDENWGEL